jgi:transcriptional regulator with XRE-family HTH domain
MIEFHSSIVESPPPDVRSRLAARLRHLRSERGLTLDGLAQRSGVSRSMISLIERGESSPTAAVLDRLAAGLGVTLAALFADAPRDGAPPLSRRGDQVTWRDPESGYVRRNLSPPGFPSPIELVEVVLPPRARVAYDTTTRAVGISQQIWVLEGEVELTVGEATHRLGTGDCLAMRLDRPIAFRNPARRPARYVVALTADTPRGGHGSPARRDGLP